MRGGRSFAQAPLPPFYVVKLGYAKKTAKAKKQNIGSKLRTVESGKYENWDWKILATPSLMRSWHHWNRFVREIQSYKHRSTKASYQIKPVLTWATLIKRLYRLDAYIIGSAPQPIYVIFVLVPEGEAHSFVQKLVARNRMLLKFYVPFPEAGTNPARYWEARLKAQALLQTAVYGIVKKRASEGSESTRRGVVQKHVGLACWINAAAYASIAGFGRFGTIPNGPAQVKHPENIDEGLIFWQRMRSYYRENWVIKKIYVEELLDKKLLNYVSNEKNETVFPKTGADVESINNLINLCSFMLHHGEEAVPKKKPRSVTKGFFPANHSSRNRHFEKRNGK